MTLHERIARRIVVAPSGHWVWVGARDRNGYGIAPLGRRGARALAHRVVYEALVGPIADGLEVDHLCRYTRCVNPTHLQPVTHAVNMARAAVGRRRKLVCPQGHPYGGHNSMAGGRGRRCRTCHNASSHTARDARRAAA